MKVCVTGATGFVGAHVTAKLVQAGHEVKVTVRDRSRLRALEGVDVEPVEVNVLDRRALRRAFAGCELVFHAAGLVASRPESEVWRVNAIGPRFAVEAAARAGVRRVVVTSSVGALGPARGGRAANEQNRWPEQGTGLIYTDAKHEGELAALEAGDRLGLDVVAVNPAYVLGTALNRRLAGETSTRIVANYIMGRLPAIVDSFTNIVDVEDVARGHVLAARKGRAGEQYILGGDNLRWSDVIARVAQLSGIEHPIIVLPPAIASAAGALGRIGGGGGAVEGMRLMAPDWRYSSAKARRELGYAPRSATETLRRTVDWYLELIEDDRMPARRTRSFDHASGAVRLADRLGLLLPLKVAGSVAGRRTVLG
jgi:dihydroflavonol-4-reductase